MKKIVIPIIVILLFSTLATATLNDLAMSVASDQSTQLIAGNDDMKAAAGAYNMIQNPTSIVESAVRGTVQSAAPEFVSAYTMANGMLNSPQGFVVSTATSKFCEAQSSQTMCNAYQQGTQLYNDPTGAAMQYALQKVAEENSNIGAKIQQAYVIKGYMDKLKAKPSRSSQPAEPAEPAIPTVKAVAEKKSEPNTPFKGQADMQTAALDNCLVGFSFDEETRRGEKIPFKDQILNVDDITNCELEDSVNINISPFLRNPDKKNMLSGKGCTITKMRAKNNVDNEIYLHNTDSCSIIIDGYEILNSEKGSYIMLIENEQGDLEIGKGRFFPPPEGEFSLFKFRDAQFKIPNKAILNYDLGRFFMDFGSVENISPFKMITSEGEEITILPNKGFLEITQPLKGNLGFSGEGEIQSATNKIRFTGSVITDESGTLTKINPEDPKTEVLVYFENYNLKTDKTYETIHSPKTGFWFKVEEDQDPLKIFPNLCNNPSEGSVESEFILCPKEDEGFSKIRYRKSNPQIAVFESFELKKDASLKEIVDELRPDIKHPYKKSSLQYGVCQDNLGLKARENSCADIKAGENVHWQRILLDPNPESEVTFLSRGDGENIEVRGVTDMVIFPSHLEHKEDLVSGERITAEIKLNQFTTINQECSWVLYPQSAEECRLKEQELFKEENLELVSPKPVLIEPTLDYPKITSGLGEIVLKSDVVQGVTEVCTGLANVAKVIGRATAEEGMGCATTITFPIPEITIDKKPSFKFGNSDELLINGQPLVYSSKLDTFHVRTIDPYTTEEILYEIKDGQIRTVDGLITELTGSELEVFEATEHRIQLLKDIRSSPPPLSQVPNSPYKLDTTDRRSDQSSNPTTEKPSINPPEYEAVGNNLNDMELLDLSEVPDQTFNPPDPDVDLDEILNADLPAL